jgi:hypothetical protein
MLFQSSNCVDYEESYKPQWCPSHQFIPNRRPVENGDRASQHALHGTLCNTLSILWPEDSLGLRSAHITKDDWWLHTSGVIRLHPPISREAETLKLLAKILHHVISLQQAKEIDISIGSLQFAHLHTNQVGSWQGRLPPEKTEVEVADIITIRS